MSMALAEATLARDFCVAQDTPTGEHELKSTSHFQGRVDHGRYASISMKLVPLEQVATPQANQLLFPDGIAVQEMTRVFFHRFCAWAGANGFNVPEYLLPQIRVENSIEPFLFERRFASSGKSPPTREEIDRLTPWYFQVEWGAISTTGRRVDADWLLHRHRAGIFSGLAADLAGEEKSALTVMDVACSAGVMALDFAAQGFKNVVGLELSEHSVRQANYLKTTFGIDNAEFIVENARNLGKYQADIIFCGGLLYHVTFPVELLDDLFKATRKFLIFDSLCQNHPFSGFHVCGETHALFPVHLIGDHQIELMPTYRAIIDLLRSSGFREIYEIIGSQAPHIPLYQTANVRSFLAVKPGVKLRHF